MGRKKKEEAAVAVVEKPLAPPEVIDAFRQILELQIDEEVPEALLEKYNQFKRRCDICGAGEVRAKDLIMLAVCSGEFIFEGGEDLLPPSDE